MLPSFLNSLSASFSLFLDNELTYFCSGYNNVVSGQLYQSFDPNFSQFNIWASPFRQFVADSSVTTIPSGVFNNSQFIPRGISGLTIDFLRGRILYSGTLNDPILNYSIKQFPIYFSEVLDNPDFLIETAFVLQPTIFQATGALSPFSITAPCIFFNTDTQNNTAAAFGSLQNANDTINCYVIATSTFQLDAALGALCDTARKQFGLFATDDLPYTVLGDIKSGYYNYNTLNNRQIRSVFIDRVRVEKKEEAANKKLGRTVFGGRVRFDLIYQFDNIN